MFEVFGVLMIVLAIGYIGFMLLSMIGLLVSLVGSVNDQMKSSLRKGLK